MTERCDPGGAAEGRRRSAGRSVRNRQRAVAATRCGRSNTGATSKRIRMGSGNGGMVSQFGMRLVFGLSLLWAVLPREQISAGFFRIQCLVVLGLGVLASLAFGVGDPTDAAWPAWWSRWAVWLAGGTAALGFVGSVLWTLQRRRGGAVCGGAILVLAASWLVLDAAAAGGGMPGVVGRAVNELLSGALLGGCVGSMLLGHWYLTAPAMSHRPLFRAIAVVGVAAAARLAYGVGAGVAGTDVLRSVLGQGAVTARAVWLGLHWLPGILGPLVMAVLAWRIMKGYGNTQAATGVLFVAVICSFLGEMSALLLQRDVGWPL
ncbi:MAG: hypothetical protein D6725_07495 [Planctomycetota bacterium]|nr:MAG: hypothetical protein D6725_07495 [Planctomycetota bacterium]